MIANKYELLSKIGEGAFGKVFEGRHHRSQNRVAMKMEAKDAPINTLKHEAAILYYLYENGCRCTPEVYWYGKHQSMPTMVMPFYEISLHSYLQSFRPSSTMINNLVWIMVDILETIHTHFVIHRDIKPQNFMLRWPANSSELLHFFDENATLEYVKRGLVLIDFGMSTIYVDEYKEHVSMNVNKTTIIGSPKFASIHIHNGIEPSRRDDIISVGYIWWMMYYGGLPWEEKERQPEHDRGRDRETYSEHHILHEKNQERLYSKTSISKTSISKTSISKTAISKTPIVQEPSTAIQRFIQYAYGIHYSETPKYKEIKEMITETGHPLDQNV